MATARRPAIYGPEPWSERHGQVWSHWDRWFALVAIVDHDGDLAGVAATLDDHPALYLGEDAQAKLAYLDDLTVRFMTRGIDAAGLLGNDEVDKTVLATARRKVVTQALSGRDLTGPMPHPPRRQLRDRALRGSWPAFRADPAKPYRLLAELVEDRSDIWVRQTFELVRDLEALVAGLVEDAGDQPARVLAVRRASLTAIAGRRAGRRLVRRDRQAGSGDLAGLRRHAVARPARPRDLLAGRL